MREPLTLGRYVERRTGVPLGAKGSLRLMLQRSLGAGSFHGFWLYWNPIWGYYLARFVNAPLRRVLPKPLALVATFVASGLVHDAAIVVLTGTRSVVLTVWFGILGLAVVVTERIGLRYDPLPWITRAGVNLGILALGFGLGALVRNLTGL